MVIVRLLSRQPLPQNPNLNLISPMTVPATPLAMVIIGPTSLIWTRSQPAHRHIPVFPIYFSNGTLSVGTWRQFADVKTPSTAYADRGLYICNKFGGGTEFDFRTVLVIRGTSGPVSYGTTLPGLWSGGNPNSG